MPYIEIGAGPCEEECAQVGDKDYCTRAMDECNRFIDLIRKKLGPEPDGAKLKVMGFQHEFGTYHEVVCQYDDLKQESADYAYKVEANAPTHWEH